MRINTMLGRLEVLEPDDTWPELYDTYEEMAAFNGAGEENLWT